MTRKTKITSPALSVGILQIDTPTELSPFDRALQDNIQRRTLARMGEGITVDAREFLKTCAHSLQRGEAPLPAYATALAKMLDAIRTARTPWGVPLLRRAKGQKAADEQDAQDKIAHRVYQLIFKGVKRDAAYLQTDGELTLKSGTARRAWLKLKDTFSSE